MREDARSLSAQTDRNPWHTRDIANQRKTLRTNENGLAGSSKPVVLRSAWNGVRFPAPPPITWKIHTQVRELSTSIDRGSCSSAR